MKPLYSKGELDDKEILNELHEAISLYEQGEILEARTILRRIAGAIDRFEKGYEL